MSLSRLYVANKITDIEYPLDKNRIYRIDELGFIDFGNGPITTFRFPIKL